MYNFFVSSPTEAVSKCIWVDFKELPNGINFILIDHCIGELLLIKCQVNTELGYFYFSN